MTYTYAFLSISKECFEEAAAKLNEAGYTQAFHKHEGVTVIDMNGIALKVEDKAEDTNDENQTLSRK